jgi:hypothetical protein
MVAVSLYRKDNTDRHKRHVLPRMDTITIKPDASAKWLAATCA